MVAKGEYLDWIMSTKRRYEGAQAHEPVVKRQRSTRDNDARGIAGTEKGSISRPGTSTGHLRFGSEEPCQDQVDKVEDALEQVDEEDIGSVVSSDDDAPETVRTNDAQASILAAATRTRKAVERDRDEGKRKRRQADERFKAQLKQSKKHNDRMEEVADRAVSSDEEDGSGPVDAPSTSKHTQRLPDLLPEELLTDELFQRPPTPEKETKRSMTRPTPTKRHIKFPKKPKDRTVGALKLSILEQTNPHLAPKASKRSQSLRESWLTGNRGSNPRNMGRKAFKQSFVRA